jgi:hypothetical protein
MEVVYGVLGVLSLTAIWVACGLLVVYGGNLLTKYLTGVAIFDEDLKPFHPIVMCGPFMFVLFLYPIWLAIEWGFKAMHKSFGRTVVVEDISKYEASYRDGYSGCTKKASTKALSNFFKSYLEKEVSKFYLSNEGDKNALENFFRIDGWRNVSEGVWTKIVKVSDLNVVG